MPKGIPNKKAEELEQSMGGAIAEETVIENPIPGAVKEAPAVDSEYKIEVIKDYDGNVDIFYLPKKDPRYEYRFLRDDSKNLSMATGNMLFQGGGWQLCDRDHLKRIGVEDRYIGPDGLHHRGDLILGFIPKHLHAEKMKYDAQKAKDQMNAIDVRLKEGSSEGAGIHESMKGIQTQKQLGIE